MKKMCPSCGRAEEKSEFVGAFCPRCYGERHELFSLPRVMEVTFCPTCGKTLSGFRIPLEKQISAAILAKVKSAHKIVDSSVKLSREGKHYVALVDLVFSVDGKRVSKQARVIVRVNKKQCEECSRKSSGYFEAIIQFRVSGERDAERVERKASKAIALLQKTTFIPRVERLAEGVDVFVGSAAEAQKALHELNLSYTTSKKLAGVKDGRKISRTTFCARF